MTTYQITSMLDDHGSIVRFNAVDLDTNLEVVVAVDHRCAQDIVVALRFNDPHEPVLADAPSWAVTPLGVAA